MSVSLIYYSRQPKGVIATVIKAAAATRNFSFDSRLLESHHVPNSNVLFSKLSSRAYLDVIPNTGSGIQGSCKMYSITSILQYLTFGETTNIKKGGSNDLSLIALIEEVSEIYIPMLLDETVSVHSLEEPVIYILSKVKAPELYSNPNYHVVVLALTISIEYRFRVLRDKEKGRSLDDLSDIDDSNITIISQILTLITNTIEIDNTIESLLLSMEDHSISHRIPSVKDFSGCTGGRIRISDIFSHFVGPSELNSLTGDEDVSFCGWVRTKRSQGVIQFIELNDGSCLKSLQIVVNERTQFNVCEGDSAPRVVDCHSKESDNDLIATIHTGTALRVNGKLVKSPAKSQAVEVQATEIQIIGSISDPNSYPLSKKRHSREFLRGIAHLRPRTNIIGAVSRVRSSLAFSIHQFFAEKGFLYIHTPLITSSDCEGAGEMFSVKTTNSQGTDGEYLNGDEKFFGRDAFLAVSGQLSVENYAQALGDVYTFGPTFRAENSHTSRHLSEFWMVEPEMAFSDLVDNMNCAEQLVQFCINKSLLLNSEDLSFFDSFVDPGLLERLKGFANNSFERLTYNDAIDILTNHVKEKKVKFKTHKVEWGMDLSSEHERYLCEVVFRNGVMVYNYPRDIKSFYMRDNDDGKTCAAMDLLLPRIGELAGGSQREERLSILDKKIEEKGLNKEDYWWYRDLRKYGTCKHSGFGLGFDRLVMMVTGVENIRDVIPFPRYPGHCEF